MPDIAGNVQLTWLECQHTKGQRIKRMSARMPIERKPKRSDGYTIEQIVALAAEANMTYGEYVQKMEEGLV